MFDTIVIGSGPAGITAAIYAIRRAMKVLLIGKNLGGQVSWASEIKNYPGFNNISSFELIERWQAHLASLDIKTKNEEVIKIEKQGDKFIVVTHNGTNNEYLAKTIILANGLTPCLLNVPGEAEFTGRGVSYCVNCDGPFFKHKTIAVIGGGNCALDAAEVMSKIAIKVYLISCDEKLSGFENLIAEVKAKENIEVICKANVKEIKGNSKVTSIVLSGKKNIEQEIKVDGVFVEIGHVAKTDLVSKLVKVDKQNQIIIDAECQTNVPGIFAAGDVTNIPFKQITIACGQGAIAALSAYKYLQLKQ